MFINVADLSLSHESFWHCYANRSSQIITNSSFEQVVLETKDDNPCLEASQTQDEQIKIEIFVRELLYRPRMSVRCYYRDTTIKTNRNVPDLGISALKG